MVSSQMSLMSMETSTQSRLKLQWLSTKIKYPGKIISPLIHLVNCSSSVLRFLCLQFSNLLSRRDGVMMRKGNSRLGLCKADPREKFCYKFASQLIKHIFTGNRVAINLKPVMFRILQAIWFDNLHRLLQLSCWSKPTSSIYEFTFLDGFWSSEKYHNFCK